MFYDGFIEENLCFRGTPLTIPRDDGTLFGYITIINIIINIHKIKQNIK